MYQQYQDSFSHTAYIGPYREKVSWRYLQPQIQEYRPDPVPKGIRHGAEADQEKTEKYFILRRI